MQIKSFIKWACTSLIGLVVFVEFLWLGPMYVVFLIMMHSESALTLTRALYIGFACSIAGFVIAVLGWYTVLLPLLKKNNRL